MNSQSQQLQLADKLIQRMFRRPKGLCNYFMIPCRRSSMKKVSACALAINTSIVSPV